MADLTGLKVMVIDDSTTILRAAEIYLQGPKDQPTGIVIETRPNGFDAINDIFRFEPDIIFLDQMMPKVEGFLLCDAIKNNPKLKDTKIIMLTSKDGIFDRAKGAAAGADAYMTKPFLREPLLKMVADHAPARFRNSAPDGAN